MCFILDLCDGVMRLANCDIALVGFSASAG